MKRKDFLRSLMLLAGGVLAVKTIGQTAEEPKTLPEPLSFTNENRDTLYLVDNEVTPHNVEEILKIWKQYGIIPFRAGEPLHPSWYNKNPIQRI